MFWKVTLSVSELEVLSFRKNKKIGSANICVFGTGGEDVTSYQNTTQKSIRAVHTHDPQKTCRKEKSALGWRCGETLFKS